MIDHPQAQVFTVRRPYFDAIVSGEMTVEIRRASPYWRKVATRLRVNVRIFGWAEAVFLCGHEVHRRKIVQVLDAPTAEQLLGRPISEQGRKDVGDGPVVGFALGEKLGYAPEEGSP